MLDHSSLSSLFARFEHSLERFGKLAFGGANVPNKFNDALERTNKQLVGVTATAVSLQTIFTQLQHSASDLSAGFKAFFPSFPVIPQQGQPQQQDYAPAPGEDDKPGFGSTMLRWATGADISKKSEGWDDRAPDVVKASNAAAKFIGLFTGEHGFFADRILKNTERADKGFDIRGDVKNIIEGGMNFREGNRFQGIIGILGGLGGLASDIRDMKGLFQKPDGPLDMKGLLSRPQASLGELAESGGGRWAEGAIGRGGASLMASEAPEAGGLLARFLPFLGTEAGATATAGAGMATAEAGGTLAASGGLIALFESNPVGWAITAVAAVAALAFGVYELYEHWGAVKAFFAKLWSDVCGYFSSALAGIAGYLENLGPVKWLMAKWQIVAPYFRALWSQVAGAFTWVRNVITGIVIDYLVPIWQRFKNAVQSVWNWIGGYLQGKWNQLVGLFNWGGGRIRALVQWIGQGAARLLMGAWSGVSAFFKWVMGGVAGAFTWAWNKIKPIYDMLVGAMKWLEEKASWVMDKTGVTGAVNSVKTWLQKEQQHGDKFWSSAGHPPMHQQVLQHHLASNPPRLPPPRAVARTVPVHTAAPVRSTAPARVANPAPAARPFEPRGSSLERRERGYADIKVHFENTPQGTRVSTRTGGCCPPHVETGVAFGH